MERKRSPISTIIFIVIMFMMFFSPLLESSPRLSVLGLIAVVLTVFIIARRQGRLPWKPAPREPFRISPPPSKPLDIPRFEIPRIGKWVIMPIAIIGVVALVLFQNWWLNVSILQSMYDLKAGIDWWSIQFLNNHYFYACLGIGLLIALSDPRVSITRDVDGERRIYLHSKFLGVLRVVLRVLRSQVNRFTMEDIFALRMEGLAVDDKVSLKQGLAWKLLQFLIGAFIIGPPLAQGLALQHLIIAKWVETQQISWMGLIQRTASILWTRLFTSEMPSGAWLIANSPALEFLTWLRMPVIIFCVIWSLRLGVSLVFGFLKGDVAKILKSIVLIGLAALTPFILQIPTKVFDITTPFYVRSMVIGELSLITLAIFFSLRESWVQRSMNYVFRRKIMLTAIVLLVSISVLSGPIVVAFQYAPAMEGNWKKWVWTPQVEPTVEYTQWATGLEGIVEDDLAVAMNTGENLEILGKIRVFNDAAAKLRLKPKIGVNWMDIKYIDVVWSNDREYWVSALTPVLPSIGGGEDVWRSERMIITHSERILAIDAGNGEILSGESVFNLTGPVSIYYGEGGVFESSDMVYIGIPEFPENHLPEYTGPPTYVGEPDYVLKGFNRLWFFSGIYGPEGLRWDFGRGDYGDVRMLYLRDVRERLSKILLPDMTVDDDPYLVSDGENLYYALYVYIDRKMPTEYLDYPNHKYAFLRNLAVILIDTYDGSMQGYLMKSDKENYVTDFYQDMYPQWDKPIPNWLKSQLRYPEFLFERQIESYNTYHVSDPDVWQGKTDFFELTTDSRGVPIEDVRYVVFYLNETNYWASVRLVQNYESPALNLAATYVALNGENFGRTILLRGGTVAVIGPQTALDAVNNYSPTKSLITLHPNWVHGNTLMYVINGTIYYFVPFYAQTATSLAPAMMTCIDALTQDVGYYVINNPQDAAEVEVGSEKAYFDLAGLKVELGAEDRKNSVLDKFEELNYTIKTPQQLTPHVAFLEGSVSYLDEDDWPQTQIIITSFADTWVKPNNLSVILMWEAVEAGSRLLNFGVLVRSEGVVELHYVTVIYTSG